MYAKQRRYQPTQIGVSGRAAFTIVELLIVVGLLLLLAVMTASAVNLSMNNDKVRGGARQVQSYLAGARDRAIYAKQPRGVRFLLDPTNNRTVSSLAFIAPTEPWRQGRIELERAGGGRPATVVKGFDTGWQELINREMLQIGSRIEIPADSGIWYTISSVSAEKLVLKDPYIDAPNNPNSSQLNSTNFVAFVAGGPSTYQLELPATLMPNQEPVLLPKGAVIHLDRCTSMNHLEQSSQSVKPSLRGDKLPSNWKVTNNFTPGDPDPFTSKYDPSGFSYSNQMDIMFSPRGIVTGTAAQRGIIHLYIGDQKDADRDRIYWFNPVAYPTRSAPEYGDWNNADYPSEKGYSRGDKVVLTIFTRTGAVSTHSVYSNSDPFKFAETGEVAGK